MKSQETMVSEIESDIQMTVKRRSSAYAGEHAGWLDRAAKRLLKVEDQEIRVELFMKIVRRALKLLRVVDDSNGSLQSVLWEGSFSFEVWKRICETSDVSVLKRVLKKVLPEDTEGLADGIFFPDSALPISNGVLKDLLGFVLGDLNFTGEYRSEGIAVGCLGWLAQMKDEAGFDNLVQSKKLSDWQSWRKRFTLYLNLERYEDAIKLAKASNERNTRYVHELQLQVFERNQDRGLLMRTALSMARDRLTVDEFKRLKPLLNDEERTRFMAELMQYALAGSGFDVPFCEVLFAAGELKALHSYAIARYNEIFNVGFCTGMIPLGKKLYKSGDPLAACVFMRGAIIYLMSKGNSRYYSDVHAHRAVLAEMALAVKDWETIPSQAAFDSDFASSFANRWSFWA